MANVGFKLEEFSLAVSMTGGEPTDILSRITEAVENGMWIMYA